MKGYNWRTTVGPDGLTPRQRGVRDCITHLRHHLGYPPTLRELAAAEGITDNAIRCVLSALRRKGLVEWCPGKARTLLVVG